MKIKLIIPIIIFIIILVGCQSQKPKDLTGEILMENPNINFQGPNGQRYGLIIYTPKNNNYQYLTANMSMRYPSFSENKEKILGMLKNGSIAECDIKTKKITIIFNKKINSEVRFYSIKYTPEINSIRYIPKTDCISFLLHPYLYIYNRKTQETESLVTTEEYCWSNDGKTLFYSNDGKIYRYEMDTKRSILYIKNASGPILSENNEYFARTKISYKRPIKYNPPTIVRELKTGKEWHLTLPVEVLDYQFSPDNKYLMYSERTANNFYRELNLMVWDFKNNKKFKLFGNISMYSAFRGFDWK